MTLTTTEDVGARILILRGQKVLLDSTLAGLYGVTWRSSDRPIDFRRISCFG
jgi:hypothetical protein